MLESADIADLDHEAGSHHQVDTSKCLKSVDDRRERPSRQEFCNGVLDATEPLLGEPDCLDVFLQYDLVGRMLEILLLEPAPIAGASVLLPRKDSAVTEQK
jgi:hypothetical protein